MSIRWWIIKQFNILRPKDHNICAVVSDKEEDTKIYFYQERSAINTISEDLQNSRNSKPAKTFYKKSLTLEQIIDDSVYASSKINLLSIDVENYEYNILKNFNFEKYKIDVIVVEIHDYKQEKLEIFNQSIEYVLNSNVYSLLTKNNYKMINWYNLMWFLSVIFIIVYLIFLEIIEKNFSINRIIISKMFFIYDKITFHSSIISIV